MFWLNFRVQIGLLDQPINILAIIMGEPMSFLIRTMALIKRRQTKVTSLDTTSVGVKDLTPSNKSQQILAIKSLCCMNTYVAESTVKVPFVELFYGNNALSYSPEINILQRDCHGYR